MKRTGARGAWCAAIAALVLVAGCGRKGTSERTGKKADDVVTEKAGNVPRGSPPPAPTPTRPTVPRKPIKY